MLLQLITPPAEEPIALTDVEGQCRITSLSDEASTVNLFISACRQRCESITKRALVTQSWQMQIDGFPLGRKPIEIPLPPLQTVDSITYTDQNGDSIVLDPAYYRVLTGKSDNPQPGCIAPIYGLNWPIAQRDFATVSISFTCGYEIVPAGIKQWLLLNVADMYEQRETIQVGNRLTVIETTIADGLIEDYRVYGPF